MVIQSENLMTTQQHQFGVDSQEAEHLFGVSFLHQYGAITVPMKGKFPNGLADAIKRRQISQAALAEAAGTSQQQVARLASGEREMTALWAERLAGPLRTSPEELVFPGLRRARVPLVSWVSAGKMAAQEGVRRADIKKYVLAADLPRGDWIVLQVQGDSMDRVAPDGSYIFVNCGDQNLINDKFYVFSTEEGDATFKRYRAGRPPRLQPFSTNPDHETIQANADLSVIGRVGRVVTDLN